MTTDTILDIPTALAPRGPGGVLVGTASFADRNLLATGRFYPARLPAAARLPYYATRFPLVEIDSSYYALPTPTATHAWADRTPPGFTINIKAFRAFTGHQTPRVALPADIRAELPGTRAVVFLNQMPRELAAELWRRFQLALEPLRLSARLGTVLFQFPAWVRASPRGEALVRHSVTRLEGCVPAIEFRHRSWFADTARTEATLALIRELGGVHVAVDEPPGFEDAVPQVWAATHPEYAMLRLHGRNSVGWARGPGGSFERFDYLYSPAELAELAAATHRLAQLARRTHVVFNTNREDQGVVNARAFLEALAATRT